jgi:hypothetical protein
LSPCLSLGPPLFARISPYRHFTHSIAPAVTASAAWASLKPASPNLNDAGRYVRTELGREYLIEVPGLSQSRLDDATAARLLNWVLRQFSAERLPADFKPYTSAEVSRFRADKVSDPKARREAILAELRGLQE